MTGIAIRLAHGSEREQRLREQLIVLLQRYNLDRWQFTNMITVDEHAISHSHPVLTLNTTALDDDPRLLAIYLHEQFHWFSGQHELAITGAIEDLRERYPVVPIGLPQGARSAFSSYLHLIIGWLEYMTLAELIDAATARAVLEGWTYYTWIYATVLRDADAIGAIIARYQLVPRDGAGQGQERVCCS